MKKFKKALSILLSIFIIIIILTILLTININLNMISFSRKYILTESEAADIDADCITVLGASVKANGTPSNMLEDRIEESIMLYNLGISNKLLMSGDHINDDYDEVNVMKNYAIDNKIPSRNIFMDHAGINTFNSMYRLKNIFEVNKTIIVTQEYHLYRAIYIARKLGIEAYGVKSNPRNYKGQFYRDVREVLARVKDFFIIRFGSKSKYEGETISVFGDGDITNDK